MSAQNSRNPQNLPDSEDRARSSPRARSRITEIHGDLWPHRLKGFKASMLVHERDFRVQQLVEWFKWEKADMAIHYTRTKDLAADMGITNLPT